MQDCNGYSRCLTRLGQLTSVELLVALWLIALRLGRRVSQFRNGPRSPQSTFEFEKDIQRLLCETGRIIVEWTWNSAEPAEAALLPPHLIYEGDAYRRKRRSPTRNLNCLFDKIRIRRWLYESYDDLGLPALLPLELQLGIVAGVATRHGGSRGALGSGSDATTSAAGAA